MKEMQSSSHPVRILLAEDHDDTRDALTLLLEMEGYEVDAARDGQEALALALERRPDIVVTDFDMPRLDGAGLSQALRSSSDRLRRVPIVLLTALSFSLAERAMEAGADMHIAKPVDFNVLGATLARLVNNVDVMSGQRLNGDRGEPGILH
jgi:CheY-like chemotaxis protein